MWILVSLYARLYTKGICICVCAQLISCNNQACTLWSRARLSSIDCSVAVSSSSHHRSPHSKTLPHIVPHQNRLYCRYLYKMLLTITNALQYGRQLYFIGCMEMVFCKTVLLQLPSQSSIKLTWCLLLTEWQQKKQQQQNMFRIQPRSMLATSTPIYNLLYTLCPLRAPMSIHKPLLQLKRY